MEILRKRVQKAEKDHRCNFCSGKISKGEDYQRRLNFTGEFSIWNSHLTCMSLAEKFKMFEKQEDPLTQEHFVTCVNDYFRTFISNPPYETTFKQRLDIVSDYIRHNKTQQES